MQPVYVILYNIRSTYNVGAILRTVDGAGVTKAYLCGYTPAPIDRFGRKRTDIAKAALGAEDSVVWEHVADTHTVIDQLKKSGVRVVAVEQDTRSVPYTALALDQPTALVLGEEVHGLPCEILDQCDEIVEIPMRGTKESLNVSVAAGVVLYQMMK
jgi:tRNA G18 (ribose-2'-O)-methylase SpoU